MTAAESRFFRLLVAAVGVGCALWLIGAPVFAFLMVRWLGRDGAPA